MKAVVGGGNIWSLEWPLTGNVGELLCGEVVAPSEPRW